MGMKVTQNAGNQRAQIFKLLSTLYQKKLLLKYGDSYLDYEEQQRHLQLKVMRQWSSIVRDMWHSYPPCLEDLICPQCKSLHLYNAILLNYPNLKFVVCHYFAVVTRILLRQCYLMMKFIPMRKYVLLNKLIIHSGLWLPSLYYHKAPTPFLTL